MFKLNFIKITAQPNNETQPDVFLLLRKLYTKVQYKARKYSPPHPPLKNWFKKKHSSLSWPISVQFVLLLWTRVRPIPGIHTNTDTRYRYIGIGIGMSKHIGICMNIWKNIGIGSEWSRYRYRYQLISAYIGMISLKTHGIGISIS